MFNYRLLQGKFCLFPTIILFLIFILSAKPVYSNDHEQELQKRNPHRAAQRLAYEHQLSRWIKSSHTGNDGLLTIPVVIHVIYHDQEENLSDNQIASQLAVLNDDFRRMNADTVSTPLAFVNSAASANIRFVLAAVDPSGHLTKGIERKASAVSEWRDNDDMKFAKKGGLNAWNTARYFNIWVCNLDKEMLGYGEYPSTIVSSTYGIVITPEAFGCTGSAKYPYNKGRTATHETGHCFGLFHLWGLDGKPGHDMDFVKDTPYQNGPTYGDPLCVKNDNGCNESARMYMNFMDYTNDSFMNLFTNGQVSRMRAVLSIAPYNKLGIRALPNQPVDKSSTAWTDMVEPNHIP